MEVHERLRETDPDARARRAELKDRVGESIDSGVAAQTTGDLITIPTVVHVVYQTEEENISDEQVNSQIEVLNRDFRATNEDRSAVPDVWQGLVADANIEFELTTQDPEGNPTNGITRTQTERESFGTEGNPVKYAEAGGIPPWPTDRYLNMWVCNLEEGSSAMRSFPGCRPRPTAS